MEKPFHSIHTLEKEIFKLKEKIETIKNDENKKHLMKRLREHELVLQFIQDSDLVFILE